MIKNSSLSELSLVSNKKEPSAIKRSRAELEVDYRQEMKKSQNLTTNTFFATAMPAMIPRKYEEQTVNDVKQKAMEANMNLPQTSHNDAYVNEIKQKILLKSDLIHKCKRVSEKVDIYLEQDEKYADTKMLKDVQKSINDGFFLFFFLLNFFF